MSALRELLKAAIALPIVLVVGFVAYVLFVMGPIGWIGLAVLTFGVAWLYGEWTGDPRDRDAAVDRVSCPECGARNEADAPGCDYCGASLVD